jgi:hypothetical protein
MRSELPTASHRDETTDDRHSVTVSTSPKTLQLSDDQQAQPGDGGPQALAIPAKRPPEGEPKERPKLKPGLNLLKWRRRVKLYAEDYASWETERRRAAMKEYLPNGERMRAAEAIESAIRSIVPVTINFNTTSLYVGYFAGISSILLLLAPPVAVLLLGQQGIGVWARVGAAALALTINFIWRMLAETSVYLWVKWRSPQRAVKPRPGQFSGNPAAAFSFPLTIIVLLFAIIPAWIAGLLPHLHSAPSSLNGGWLHATFTAVTWTFGVWAVIYIVSNMFIRAYWSLVWHRISNRLPEQQFIDRITALITNPLSKGNSSGKDADGAFTPLQYVHVMEDISTNFEVYWPRRLRTGYQHADLGVRPWARQVATVVRAQEVPLLLGQHGPADIRTPLTQVVVKVISKSTFTEAPQGDRSYRRTVWWRRLGRPIFAGLLLLIAAALIFLAAWQPGLPHLLKAWGMTGLASAASLPNDLRPSALAGAAAVFGLFVKVVFPSAPDKAGDGGPISVETFRHT